MRLFSAAEVIVMISATTSDQSSLANDRQGLLLVVHMLTLRQAGLVDLTAANQTVLPDTRPVTPILDASVAADTRHQLPALLCITDDTLCREIAYIYFYNYLLPYYYCCTLYSLYPIIYFVLNFRIKTH
jgi:hypothetical protein